MPRYWQIPSALHRIAMQSGNGTSRYPAGGCHTLLTSGLQPRRIQICDGSWQISTASLPHLPPIPADLSPHLWFQVAVNHVHIVTVVHDIDDMPHHLGGRLLGVMPLRKIMSDRAG